MAGEKSPSLAFRWDIHTMYRKVFYAPGHFVLFFPRWVVFAGVARLLGFRFGVYLRADRTDSVACAFIPSRAVGSSSCRRMEDAEPHWATCSDRSHRRWGRGRALSPLAVSQHNT